MSDFARHAQEYLRLRRALGYKLVFAGQVLPQLAAHLDAAGASTLTAELAVAWAGSPDGVQPAYLGARLSVARGLARYLQMIDPATEVPPRGVWPSANRRPVPYLWSEVDIRRLLDAARELGPPLRAATHETLFGLLAATGLRIGEALVLSREDVDLVRGVLSVRVAKGASCRLVPLHPSATDALRAYAACRDRCCPNPSSTTFFLGATGGPLGYDAVHRVFVTLTVTLGLRTPTLRPRIHDLRHSFAVRTLTGWLRDGEDIGARMAELSSYLGHVNPAGTYWYLSAAPELMQFATARLDGRFGAPR